MHDYRLREGLILTIDQKDTIEADNRTIRVLPMPQWLLADLAERA